MGSSTKLILFQILQTFDCHSREACPRLIGERESRGNFYFSFIFVSW